MSKLNEALQEELVNIITRSGEAILEVYGSDFAVQNKEDQSPLTQADLAAHDSALENFFSERTSLSSKSGLDHTCFR